MEVTVDCRRVDDGWTCAVTVGDDSTATRHAVTVSGETLRQLAPADGDPRPQVAESFRVHQQRRARQSNQRRLDHHQKRP
jgi:hypothetical protein